MKEHETLSSVFDKVRKSAPLMDKEDVHQLITSADLVKPKKLSTIKAVLVGAASSMVIFWAIYYLTGARDLQNQVMDRPIIIQEEEDDNQVKNELFDKKTTKGKTKNRASINLFYTEKELLDKAPSSIIFEDPKASSIIYPEESENGVTNDKTHLTPEELMDIKRRVLYLNEKELKKLDIKFIKNQLDYYKTYQYGNEVRATRIIAYENKLYFTKGTPGKGYWIKPWESKLHALFLTDSNAEHIQSFHFQDVPKDLTPEEYRTQQIKLFIKQQREFVPIAINAPNASTQHILWFPRTKELLGALPKPTTENIDNGNVDKPSKHININGLKVLELSPSQLSKMGIVISGVIRVPYQISNDSLYTTIGYSSKGTFLDFSTEYLYKDYYRDGAIKKDVKAMNIKNQEDEIPLLMGKEKFGNNILPGQLEKKSFIEPILVTDDLGVHWRSYRYTDKLSREDYDEIQRLPLGKGKYDKVIHQREEAEVILLSKINTLIPILVRANREDTSSFKGIGEHNWRPDVILWYEPSEALFSLLPNEIADEIRNEYAAIQRHESASSCKHFESCQITTGKINSYTIYPNPCEDELKLTMDMQLDRTFTISLHDISGNEVRNYGEWLQLKGEKEYNFSLSGLNSGMYMLLITSSKGEYIVQRIIKK